MENRKAGYKPHDIRERRDPTPLSLLSWIAIILALLIQASPADALPNHHYFQSIDYTDSEYLNKTDTPGMAIVYNGATELVYIIYGLGDEYSGDLVVYVFSLEKDKIVASYLVRNKTNKEILTPVSALIHRDMLYVAANSGDTGYLFGFTVSENDIKLAWVYKTNASLLDLCYDEYRSAVLALADGPYSYSILLIRIDPITGSLKEIPDRPNPMHLELLREYATVIKTGKVECVGTRSYLYAYIISHNLSPQDTDTIIIAFIADTFDRGFWYNASIYTGVFSIQDLYLDTLRYSAYVTGGATGDLFGISSEFKTPAVLLVDVKKLMAGDEPLAWALYILPQDYIQSDYYFYGVDLHESDERPWLGVVGSYEFEKGYGPHAFFALVNLTEGIDKPRLEHVVEVPGYSKVNNTYTLGFYRDLVEISGYVWAFGATQYSELSNKDFSNVGILFLSASIGDVLKWTTPTPPEDKWPPVLVNSSEVKWNVLHELQRKEKVDAVPVKASIDWNPLDTFVIDKAILTVYVAEDDRPPQPIPEPLIVVLIIVFTVVLLLIRRLKSFR